MNGLKQSSLDLDEESLSKIYRVIRVHTLFDWINLWADSKTTRKCFAWDKPSAMKTMPKGTSKSSLACTTTPSSTKARPLTSTWQLLRTLTTAAVLLSSGTTNLKRPNTSTRLGTNALAGWGPPKATRQHASQQTTRTRARRQCLGDLTLRPRPGCSSMCVITRKCLTVSANNMSTQRMQLLTHARRFSPPKPRRTRAIMNWTKEAPRCTIWAQKWFSTIRGASSSKSMTATVWSMPASSGRWPLEAPPSTTRLHSATHCCTKVKTSIRRRQSRSTQSSTTASPWLSCKKTHNPSKCWPTK